MTNRGTMLAAAVGASLALLGCEDSPGDEATEEPAEAEGGGEGVTADEVAEHLNDAGLPITYPITEIEPREAETRVATATHDADLFVEVYASPTERNDARLSLIESGDVRLAACDVILVWLPDTLGEPVVREQAREAQAILEDRWGPC